MNSRLARQNEAACAADASREAFCMHHSKRICDPFCGQGTTLHVAESLGADSDPKVCEVAKTAD